MGDGRLTLALCMNGKCLRRVSAPPIPGVRRGLVIQPCLFGSDGPTALRGSTQFAVATQIMTFASLSPMVVFGPGRSTLGRTVAMGRPDLAEIRFLRMTVLKKSPRPSQRASGFNPSRSIPNLHFVGRGVHLRRRTIVHPPTGMFPAGPPTLPPPKLPVYPWRYYEGASGFRRPSISRTCDLWKDCP